MSSDLTTQDSWASTAAETANAVLSFTVLWHPEVGRIGRTARVELSNSPTLSRTSPVFDDGEPLADPRVSRAPLRFVLAAGGIAVWPDRSGLSATFDGEPLRPGLGLAFPRLERGVRVTLGRRGPVVLVRLGPAGTGARHGLVGGSPLLARVRDAIDDLGPTPYPVLIRGATGTGKELVAHALHRVSGRKGRFVAINMAALSGGTAVSQLFGHAKGAFTGADRVSGGFFGEAEGGTLFLDEVGAASLELQAQLLRALESREIQPVGGAVRKADVRVVSATDEDLESAVERGAFRRALVHRLAHGQIRLSPLAERPADVATQAVHFFRGALDTAGSPGRLADSDPPWLARKTMLALLDSPWTGNTRELRAVCEQLAVRHHRNDTCGRPEVVDARPAAAVSDVTTADEPVTVEEALRSCGYRLVPAAERLGWSRNKLRREMARLGLPRPSELDASTIQTALDQSATVASAAESLKVSERGLRLRMNELGLT